MNLKELHARRDRFRADDVCVDCGDPVGVRRNGTAALRCERHLEAHRARKRRQRREAKGRGRCIWTGCERLAVRSIYCVKHRLRSGEIHRTWLRRDYAARRARGACVARGCHEDAKPGRAHCAEHAKFHRKANAKWRKAHRQSR